MKILAVILLSLFYTVGLSAADDVSIFGKVIDGANNPLADVKVVAGDDSFITKDDGVFFFDKLPGPVAKLTVMSGDIHRIVDVNEKHDEHNEIIVRLTDESPLEGYVASLGRDSQLLEHIGVNTYASESPSGELLAVEVLADDTLGFDIWIINKQGERVYTIATPANDGNPRWSTNGSMVLFQQHSKQGYRIAIHDLERDELEIVSDGLTPAWLPGDAGVLFAKYVGGNSDIYSWKFGAQAPVRLTTDPSRDQYPYAAVIDDEQKIVYASKKDSDYYDIWSMNMDGSQKRRLTYVGEEIGQRMIGPVVSPDGEKIAFWEIDYKNDHSVWIMNVDGTHLQEILKRAANPEFGQDRLYFDSKVTGRAQIWFTTY